MNEEGLQQLRVLTDGVRMEGAIPLRAHNFLKHHGYAHTFEHSQRVAARSVLIARRFSRHAGCCRIAAYLHDISAVIPNDRRLPLAQLLSLDVLPEEESAPMLLHQKISRVMASAIFGIRRQDILSAIGCHTTLKSGANTIDLVLFVADKIAWDQPGRPHYASQMIKALDVSLERSALVYLEHLWKNRFSLPGPLHPWAIAAREEIKAQLS